MQQRQEQDPRGGHESKHRGCNEQLDSAAQHLRGRAYYRQQVGVRAGAVATTSSWRAPLSTSGGVPATGNGCKCPTYFFHPLTRPLNPSGAGGWRLCWFLVLAAGAGAGSWCWCWFLVLAGFSPGEVLCWRGSLLARFSAGGVLCWRGSLLAGFSAGRVLCWRGSLLAGFSAGGVLCWRGSLLAGFSAGRVWCWRLALELVLVLAAGPGAGAGAGAWCLVPGPGAGVTALVPVLAPGVGEVLCWRGSLLAGFSAGGVSAGGVAAGGVSAGGGAGVVAAGGPAMPFLRFPLPHSVQPPLPALLPTPPPQRPLLHTRTTTTKGGNRQGAGVRGWG
ncbi:unnamed protein product [Closterium sp. NIES-64]|nr:unnamed protein product [Closterium sp. NIES-64]